MSTVSSEFVYRGLLINPQFSWLERIPQLYQTMTQAFAEVGLELTEIRSHGDSAEPAEFAVIGKAGGASITLKIMVYGIQLFWNSSSGTAPSKGTSLAQAVINGLRKDYGELVFKIQTVTWAGHLECPNLSSKEYLKRTVPPLPPELEGAEGTGISFSLPPTAERLSINVKLEPSLSQVDGVYTCLDFNWSGALSIEEVGSRTGDEVLRTLNALALDSGEVFR